MTKSFKKVIACLLAVLMVVFSFPFTALAAVGDYEPDIDLMFNAVTNNKLKTGIGENFVNTGSVNAEEDLYFIGVHGAPIDYDKKAGTLTLKADKAANLATTANDLFGEEVLAPLDADKSYGVGDVFSVTVLLKNVSVVNTLQVEIAYSQNVQPAGIGNIGKSNIGNNRKYTFATASEQTEANKTISNWLTGYAAGTMLASQAAGNYYDVNRTLGDQSSIKSDQNYFYICANSSDQSTGTQYTDISTTPEPESIPFVNPETGELGYDWSGNGMILETMFFKVVGDGPIVFDMRDPDGSIYGNHKGANYVAYNAEGTMQNQVTSYSPALDETDKGAMKMTFMGENSNRASTECKHANTEVRNKKEANCTEDGYTGDVYCTDCGELVTAGTKIDKLEHEYVPTVTAPTCTEGGYTTYVCSRCNDTYTGDETPAAGHKEAAAVEENKVDATCGKDGSYDEVVYCSVCKAEISRVQKTIPATGNHTWNDGVVTTEPTEESKGVKTYTCTVCGATKTEEIPELAHTHTAGDPVRENEVAATCAKEGSYDEVVYCSKCGEEMSRVTKTIAKTEDHKAAAAVEENRVDSTCAKEGSYDEVVYCSVCGKELSRETKTIAKKAHTPAAPVEENRVEPTADKAGSYDEVVYCDVCHEEISRVQKTIEANGVNVTVTASDLGEVEGLAYNVNNLKYGTAYSVTAKPVAGAEFVGWEVNGKLISQSATLSGVAYTDITVTPVFTEADTDTISVIFYDKYANVVAHYDNVTVADFQAEMAKAIPTAPAYPGYVFEKWSMTDDQIKAISKSQTIWATYAEVETGYTVTTDATLTLPENVENGKIPYDAEVTVSAEGATAWVIDGVTVGYGDSYTFFVGSDVTVQPSYEAATVEPKVTIINTTKMTGSHKVNFLATKNVPTGYTLVDYGFVYGKDLTSEELTIENVGKKGAAETAGAVKIVHGYTDGSDQFALNYGITAQQGTAIAKAYVVVKTADGVKVIYSDASAYNYNA